MKNKANGLLEKKYIHKLDEKNIFIYDLRRDLPQFIQKDVFLEKIQNELTPDEQNLINKFYYLNYLKNIKYLGNDGEYFVLKSIYPVLNNEIFETKINEKEREFLLSLYEFNDEEKCYALKDHLSEINELRILNIFNNKNDYITSKDKASLSDIFEKFDFLEKKDIYFASLYVDPNHDYFFEHPLDHVPGMMLLESARQFIVACAHLFGKVPLGSSQIILSKLEASFTDFVELQYPITVKGDIINKKQTEKGVWTYVDTDFSIIQNNKVVGNFKLSGSNVSIKAFEKIRERKTEVMKNFRFTPYPTFTYKFCLKNLATKQYMNTRLLNISSGGLMLEIENSCEKIEDYFFDFFLIFEGMNLIFGKCQLVWQKFQNGCYQAGFKIIEISDEDKSNLNKTIVRCCHVVENRGIF
jgi:hypothetical protein